MENRELKSLRVKYDLTQSDLADLLGISEVAYRQKENGHRGFTLIEARKISEIFKLSIEEIFFNKKVYKKETKKTETAYAIINKI